jgi:hypothetical protein
MIKLKLLKIMYAMPKSIKENGIKNSEDNGKYLKSHK